MNRVLPIAILGAILCLAPLRASAVERVYLRSGSTLIANSHVDRGDYVEVTFHSDSKVFINASDIDKIAVETSAPIDLSTVEFDPEKAMPDISDPLNEKWLDQPAPENSEASRLFLSFSEQIERGFEVPLAKEMNDIRLARRKKVKTLEFINRKFYLGMDMQYHEDQGVGYDEAFDRLFKLEETRNTQEVVEFIQDIRRSAYEPRKEYIVAQAIRLRDQLDPGYSDRLLLEDSWTAQAKQTGPAAR